MSATPKTWRMWEHAGWGNSIVWFDFDKRRMTGHLTPNPRVGDIVEDKMKSGRVFAFRVTKVDHCDGVRDMFFATVEDIGYRDAEPTIATHTAPAWIPPATVYWTEPNGKQMSQADVSVEAANVLADRARDAGKTDVEVVPAVRL